jgi:hypothetical protein
MDKNPINATRLHLKASKCIETRQVESPLAGLYWQYSPVLNALLIKEH